MSLRRLIDLPGFTELEQKALMSPRWAEPEEAESHPEIDALLVSTFGLSAEAAFDARPDGWDRIDRKPISEQVRAFEDAGWDITDDKRKPLRMMAHYALPLWLAIRGVAGSLPFAPPPSDEPDDWGSSMIRDAAKFKRDRR